ncbi:MAG: hypothetical protein JXB20_03135 [Bacilli bacterium]|nr:hypothetical protein [Bacilli bacterium]
MKRIKKYLVLVFSAIVLFGAIGCNSNPVDVDITEFVEMPTNLSIEGTVLSWDEVEGAKGYVIYVNEIEEDTVNENSYDFSSLAGEKLIFRVQAKASRGFKDSPLSASIAYVENRDGEIMEMQLALGELGMMFLSAGTAAELVDKGMTGEEVEAMSEAILTFTEEYEEADGNMLLANAALKTMMETDMNVEAIVSALLKTIVPQSLEAQIANIDVEIGYYEEMMTWYPEDAQYYQQNIDQLEEAKSMLEGLVTMLEEDGDKALLAIVEIIEYIIAFQEDFDQQFIGKINALVNNDDLEFSTLNSEELIVIKDEYVAILRENVPTMEMMVLTVEVLESLTVTVTGDASMSEYKMKYAAEAILSYELYIAYMDSFDMDFVNEVKTLGTTYLENDNEEMFNAEIQILMLEYFDGFLEENDDLITQMEELFTNEEKADIFNTYIGQIDETILDDEVLLAVIQGLDYDQMMAVQDIMDESFEVLLDSIVETDGELLRKMAVLNGFNAYYWDGNYYNSATDTTYDNFTEFENAKRIASIELIGEVIINLDAVLQNLDDADVEAVVNMFVSTIDYETIGVDSGLTNAQVDTMRTNLETLLVTHMPNLLSLLQELTTYIDSETVVQDIVALVEIVNNHYSNTFGDDYKSSDEYLADQYELYSMIIFASTHFNAYLDSDNQEIVDAMITAIFNFIKTAEFMSLADLTLEEINPIESAVNDLYDFMISEAAAFSTYDRDNLTIVQKDRIEEFPNYIRELMPTEE